MQKKVFFLYIHIRSLAISHFFYLKVLKASFQVVIKTEYSQTQHSLSKTPKCPQPEQCHLMEGKCDKGKMEWKEIVILIDSHYNILNFQILQKHIITWPFARVCPRALKGPKSLTFIAFKVSLPLSGYIFASSRKPPLIALSEPILSLAHCTDHMDCICGFTPLCALASSLKARSLPSQSLTLVSVFINLGAVLWPGN